MTKKSTGAWGEDLATVFLKKKGFKILQRNFRCRLGEIDIVAKDRDILVFVEVKTRSKGGAEMPEVAVNASKRHKLSLAAKTFMRNYKIYDQTFRFDVVGITMVDSDCDEILHWKNVINYNKSLSKRF